jgi:hypothetical protein
MGAEEMEEEQTLPQTTSSLALPLPETRATAMPNPNACAAIAPAEYTQPSWSAWCQGFYAFVLLLWPTRSQCGKDYGVIGVVCSGRAGGRFGELV